ncbi:MAG: solute-binding protein [Candidatus Limivivens sp.]|nr:solute-binding protein [Candidatus Limivivens sp.]
MKKKRSAALMAGGAVLRLLVLVLVVLAVISAGRKAYTFGYRVFAQRAVSAPPGKNVSVTVSPDMTEAELGELLEAKGLIKDANVFRVQMLLFKDKDDILPGTYILNTSQTADEMLAILAGQTETESEA